MKKFIIIAGLLNLSINTGLDADKNIYKNSLLTLYNKEQILGETVKRYIINWIRALKKNYL